MTFVRSSWCKSIHLAIVLAGGLQMGAAVETTVADPVIPPSTVPVSTPATNAFDTLIAELAPPGSSAQVTEISNAFESGSVAQKERLLVGLGTANMTNALPLVIEHVGNEDPVVALAALRACQDLKPSTSADFERMHVALKAADPRVQTRAAMVLANLEDESSLNLLINRLGSVTAPEATATLKLLQELSGTDLGDTAQPWQTWLDAEIEAADAKIPLVQQGLTNKDPELVIMALKEASTLRIRRSLLVPSIVPLLAHADAKVASMAEMSLKAMGGPVAQAALQLWQREHPLAPGSGQTALAAVLPAPEPPTIAAQFSLSPGVQDFLVVSGILFVFCTVFMILGRPTKKAFLKIDQATGGHMTRRLVKAKAQGQAALKQTTAFFKRGTSTSARARALQPSTPALVRKTPSPEDGAVTK